MLPEAQLTGPNPRLLFDAISQSVIKNLFVVDTEAPWIRSFVRAMPEEVKVCGFRVQSLLSSSVGICSQLSKFGRTEVISSCWNDTWTSIPGWNRAYRLSSWIVTLQIRRKIRELGQPDAILFTLPWYANVAASLKGTTNAYYAHDTFRYYGWNNNKVIPLEKKMLDTCSVAFAVAKKVAEDLEEMTSTPIKYLPMATNWQSGHVSTDGDAAAENNLAHIPRPIIGCVGQINKAAYDWDLIEQLSKSFPNASFVFIGNKFKEPPGPASSRLAGVFSLPNVVWLGPKPHAHLPAYLKRFDVCFNPLGVTDHNNRRSPLRLFDYLTTDRPIVSTAITEAFNHVPLVQIARSNTEFCQFVAEALKLKSAPDLEKRKSYINANTWQMRAKEFCSLVSQAST
jgi:hypothetical protein